MADSRFVRAASFSGESMGWLFLRWRQASSVMAIYALALSICGLEVRILENIIVHRSSELSMDTNSRVPVTVSVTC